MREKTYHVGEEGKGKNQGLLSFGGPWALLGNSWKRCKRAERGLEVKEVRGESGRKVREEKSLRILKKARNWPNTRAPCQRKDTDSVVAMLANHKLLPTYHEVTGVGKKVLGA